MAIVITTGAVTLICIGVFLYTATEAVWKFLLWTGAAVIAAIILFMLYFEATKPTKEELEKERLTRVHAGIKHTIEHIKSLPATSTQKMLYKYGKIGSCHREGITLRGYQCLFDEDIIAFKNNNNIEFLYAYSCNDTVYFIETNPTGRKAQIQDGEQVDLNCPVGYEKRQYEVTEYNYDWIDSVDFRYQ